jgi:hypothetical protein|tara:strand:+ start:2551 stop:2829 length:279 start_codon:yes stop_codon:yes gene_type:complete
MRFHLIVISISLLVIVACTSYDSYSNVELLDSFHKTPEYIDYRREKPITSQVVVIIEVEGIDEAFFFPNPYVAKLFEDFLKTETNLLYSSSY